MELEVLIRKNTEVLGGSLALLSLLARVVRKFFDLVRGCGDVKLQLVGVEKLIGWYLELNFVG